ncbi:MAG TPA: aldose 1-epimerase family protein [Pontiellaceae bacterium]|nr:aldose 1-epimerase family protein [Pontiellaceae bacterium]HPR83335.1 aldose 1-epimerase family protein [Pontiellaceae bacterium]
MHSITNGILNVYVKSHGAELCSLKDSGGNELLWQADPAVWNRHAPVLFPIVGKLLDGRYTLNGKTCELPPHGFARDMDFALIERRSSDLVYQLLPTAETRKSYPFEFDFRIAYHLTGQTLGIRYTVKNGSKETMPFSVGAHPAFMLPGPIDECFLDFEKNETLYARLLSSKGLLSNETVPVLKDSNRLPLSKTLFDRDALIFLDTASDRITLGAKNSSRRLTVEFPGFPQLGIWAKPGAPFVCIEPWYGHADPEQPYGDIMNKPGIRQLPAGGTFTCEHRILVKE